MVQQSSNHDLERGSVDTAVRALYRALLTAWNEQDAAAFAACFEPDGNVVGFDGSEMHGPAEIESTLAQIFAHHATASYVAKVREVSLVAPDIALLRGVAGMVPPGKEDLNPAVNAIQSMVARSTHDTWRILLFQNTPAAFHGRPELVEQMTAELREVLGARQ